MMLKLSRLMLLVFLSTGSGLFAEDFLRANMDPKVNPGDDFFTHANGRWLRRNPIPRSESAWGIGNLVREELYANLRRINEHSSAAGGPVGSEQRKIGDFWATALNVRLADRVGIEPLRVALRRIDFEKKKAIRASIEFRIIRRSWDGPKHLTAA